MLQEVISKSVGAVFGAVVGATLTWLLSRHQTRKARREAGKARDRVRGFWSSPAGKYNMAYYRHLARVIRAAKSNVYFTGQGIDVRTAEEGIIAQLLVDAMRFALKKKGLRLVRLQTKQTSAKWISMVAQLLKEFPDTFEFYVLRKDDHSQISSVTVVDPDDPECNVVEVILSVQKVQGTTVSDVAGPSIFLKRDQDLARDLQRRLLALTDASASIRLMSPDDVSLLDREHSLSDTEAIPSSGRRVGGTGLGNQEEQ